MRKLLTFAAAVAFAGCNLTASVTEPAAPAPIYDAGFKGEGSMLVCKMHSTDECVRFDVETDGRIVERIKFGTEWTEMTESECRDGHCYAKDEDGTEWKLEP